MVEGGPSSRSHRRAGPPIPMPAPSSRFKYLDALTTAFVVILLVSNLVAQKVCLHRSLRHQRRGAALSHHLYLWRRLHRGLRLRRLAPRHLARLLRHRAALRHGSDRHRAARRSRMEEPAGLRHRLRRHPPHPRRQPHRLLGGRVRQLLHHGAAQAPHQRPQALDPHHRLHHRRPGRRHRPGHHPHLRRNRRPSTPCCASSSPAICSRSATRSSPPRSPISSSTGSSAPSSPTPSIATRASIPSPSARADTA